FSRDWSSDVCSSDLKSRICCSAARRRLDERLTSSSRRGRRFLGRGVRSGLFLECIVIVEVFEVLEILQILQRLWRRIAVEDVEQIGRASCRERVSM